MVLAGAAALGLLWTCPIGLLLAGVTMRRREKRIAAVWQLLKRSGELPVRDLLANSDFTMRDLERAVRLLNTRGLGHYVWDRKSNTIRDARLQRSTLHIEKCDACHAEVSIEIPIAAREIPRCPYCSDPVSVEGLEERRRQALAAVRDEERPEPAEAQEKAPVQQHGGFSLPLFLILLIAFWPAALAYAYFQWQRSG